MSRLPAAGGAHLVVLRNVWVHKGGTPWTMALFSVYEPVLYLLAMGVGVGALVGDVPGIDVPYAAFVAPALLAAAMMNSALEETTNTVYGKLKFDRYYHSLLVTPITVRGMVAGELLWAAARALVTGVGFLAVIAAFGLVRSPWAVLAVPAGLLTAFAFGAFGLAAAGYARGWHSFQYVQLVMLPMFLFATTFYPVTVYTEWVRALVEALPLYHAIELSRGLALGELGPGLLLNAAYLLVFGGVMAAVAQSRWATLMAR
ncbi:ABC transporter permease [Herbidospora sp. NBRC 101105]|uniref:ABC transporter permease n=1 Tax=Herbidospora sp. NBRC 101105 TaxID=3032195 RepID=UPI0024A22A28|nr:ABC transporter permease [Herbidospora sp. NBRC 101105]GLX97755.1 transport permease protein [Herbidospora sp. NBRC 101105]